MILLQDFTDTAALEARHTDHWKHPVPCLVLDLERFAENYRAIANTFTGVAVHYAIKCNPDQRVLETLHCAGAGFEVASPVELRQVLALGAKPADIFCLHPIKAPGFLKELHQSGIRVLAADCAEEIDKIALCAPGSEILIRVDVPNEGSAWDLSGKFGTPLAQVIPLLLRARNQGLVPAGLTMHVGSQCARLATWEKAVAFLRTVWCSAEQEGMFLRRISLGGGLPAVYNHPIPDCQTIRNVLAADLDIFRRAGCLLSIEPGRAIAATAGMLITEVMGVAQRLDGWWAYIDVGTYNGLIEGIETEDRQLYPVSALHSDRPERVYNIGGPSCAGADVPLRGVRLPELHVGDRLFIENTGAYTLPCAAPFNGFPIPQVLYREDLPKSSADFVFCRRETEH